MKHLLLIGSLCLVCIPLAQANVYSCVVNGEKVYTNKRTSNCHEEKLDKLGSYSSDKAALYRSNQNTEPRVAPTPKNTSASINRSAAVPTRPANPMGNAVATAPTVTPAPAQSQRDQGRREILMTELSNEKKALAQARLALTNGRLIRNQPDARKQQSLASLERAVEDRQQNIMALQNELSRL